jgi:DNA-binding CsgD family transcriptional regulator/GAF domain-containing protein
MAIARVKGAQDQLRRGRSVLREYPTELPDEQDALAAVTEQLARVRMDPDEILEVVTSTLTRLRWGIWFAALINKDPRTITVVVASESEPGFARFVLDMPTSDEPAPSPLWKSILENGESFFRPDMPFDEFLSGLKPELRDYFVNRQSDLAPNLHLGVLVAPMRARGAVLGALGLCQGPSSNPLSADDIGWVKAIAYRTACAAETAQLHVDAAHRLERLAALRSVGLAVSGSPDLRLTMQVILDQTVAGLGVDAAGILLVDTSDGLLQWAATRGFRSASVPDYRLQLDEVDPTLKVVGSHSDTAIPRALVQFRRRSLFAREGFTDYRALPLVARAKLVGVFEIFHRSRLQPDQESSEFFAALASEAAIAIDYAEMVGRHEQAGSDHTRSHHDLGTLDTEILNHVAQGLTNRVIAGKVHLSEHTIKFRVHKMFVKLGVSNRTELARKATQEGWLQ